MRLVPYRQVSKLASQSFIQVWRFQQEEREKDRKKKIDRFRSERKKKRKRNSDTEVKKKKELSLCKCPTNRFDSRDFQCCRRSSKCQIASIHGISFPGRQRGSEFHSDATSRYICIPYRQVSKLARDSVHLELEVHTTRSLRFTGLKWISGP